MKTIALSILILASLGLAACCGPMVPAYAYSTPYVSPYSVAYYQPNCYQGHYGSAWYQPTVGFGANGICGYGYGRSFVGSRGYCQPQSSFRPPMRHCR